MTPACVSPQRRADLADRVRVDAADLRRPLGRVVAHHRGERAVVVDALGDELAVDEAAPDHLVEHAVVEGDVRARLDLAEDVGVLGDPLAPRVDDDQLRAAPPGLLEERRGDGVVRGRVGPREDRHAGVDDVAVGGRDRAGADALEQRGDAGGVAQARAVVDVVGAEARADQLLEEVGLLVGALRRAEAGDRPRAVLAVDGLQAAGRQVERLLPRRLAEVRHDLVVVDDPARPLAPAALAAHVGAERALRVGDADQRRREALRRGGVVPAVAALDAQAVLVAGLRAALGEGDRVALLVDVVGERTADAAVRADGVDGLELGARPDRHVADRLVGQRARRAGRDALPARHARRLAHRVVQVEGDPRLVALAGAADDVVALDVVAGADAAVAHDAGVVVDMDDRVGVVHAAPARDRQPLAVDGVAAGQREQQVVARGRLLRVLRGAGLIGHQQLGERHPLPLHLRRRGLDLHPVLARAHARGGHHAAARVDRAHAADADGVVALVVAEHRDVDADLLRGGEDRRPLRDRHLDPVDRAGHRGRVGLGRDRQGHAGAGSLVWTNLSIPLDR